MTEKQFKTKQAKVSDTELMETIETKLSKLCKTGGRSLSMSVPPQVSDIDMAICELIRRYKQLIIADVVGSFVLYREGAIDRIYWNGEEFTPYKLNIPTYTWDKANEYSTLMNCNFTDK